MPTTTATRVAQRFLGSQDPTLLCGQQDKCCVGIQDVALLVEGKVGEVQSLEFETPITGSNQVPWVGRMVDGRVIEGSVTMRMVVRTEEVRTWADVVIGNVY
jgi:hypothetical protein